MCSFSKVHASLEFKLTRRQFRIKSFVQLDILNSWEFLRKLHSPSPVLLCHCSLGDKKESQKKNSESITVNRNMKGAHFPLSTSATATDKGLDTQRQGLISHISADQIHFIETNKPDSAHIQTHALTHALTHRNTRLYTRPKQQKPPTHTLYINARSQG